MTDKTTAKPVIESVMSSSYFSWSWDGVGFGQMSYSIKNGKIEIYDEFMGKERVREIFIAFIDYLLEHGTLDRERFEEKKRLEGLS